MQIPGMIDLSSGDEAKAQVEGEIGGEAQKFIQSQFVDPAMEKKGQQAAEQEGANFQEMPGYTEAQRAYNKSGDPIAASMLSTNLQSQANQYFMEAKKNGFPENSVQTLQGQMQAWTDQTRNTQDPRLHAITIEQSNKLTSILTRQIQAAQFKQQRAQAGVLSNNQREASIENAETMGYHSGIATLQNFAPMHLAIHQTIANEVVSGNLTPAQGYTAQQDATLRIQRAQMIGAVRNRTTVFNSPGNTPQDKEIAAENLQKFPELVLTDPAFAGKNRFQLYKEAQTLIKESLKSTTISSAASKLSLQNQAAQVTAGKPLDTNLLNTNLDHLSVTDQATALSKINAGKAEWQHEKAANGMTIAQNYGASSGAIADLPGVLAKDQAAAKMKLRGINKRVAKTLSTNPQEVNATNPALVSMQEQMITGLPPTAQKSVNMTMANPVLGLLSPQSPQTLQAINTIYNKRTAFSRQQGGPGYFLTNSDAATLWSSISKLQPAEQVQTLNKIRQTITPQHFNMLENQIQNTVKTHASAFVGSYLSTGENTSNLLDSLHGSQMITQVGKESRNQNEIGTGSTVAETLSTIDKGMKHPKLSQDLSGITRGFIAAGRTSDAVGLRSIAANYYLSQEAKGSQTPWQDTEDMLNQNYTMYTKHNSNAVIPNHYIDDSGKSQQTDMDNVHSVMNYMISNPDRFIDYSNSFKKIAAANPNNKFNVAAAKAKLKVGLHFVGTPSGGFALVNSVGAPLLSKSGMPVGFDAKTADDYAAKIKAFHEKDITGSPAGLFFGMGQPSSDGGQISKDSPFFRAIAPWADT